MQQYRKNLGKVSLTAEGAWNLNNSYDILSIVYDEHTQHGFISRKAVPQGVDLYNKEYWMPLNVSGYVDNNVIILSKKTSDASIQSYTLEEAIASIKSVGRRPGAILGFYNENNDRLDIGGRWELWQFNDTNVYNWENVDSWQNLYYNYNKFMGWFKDENFLTKYAPFPEIGCYAFVGSEFNEATVYRCDNKYVWNNTTQHAWDYVKIVVDGNVTVGENGNWFNNGEDTGIPASVKGENGKTPVFREKDNTIQYSFDNVNWITISDKVAAWFRWNATTGDTQANNVGRIQISRDNVTWTNLSGDIINNLHISRYIGADETLPTSGIAEGTIYAKGPTYDENDISHANPIYRLWVYAWKGNTLAWQDNGEFTSIAAGVVQETGDSETEVMSQKASSDNFGIYTKSKEWIRLITDNNKNILFGIDEEGGIYIPKINYIEGLSFLTNHFNLENSQEYAHIVLDISGKILEAIKIDGKKYFPMQELLDKVSDIENRTEMVLDKSGNIIAYRDSEGIKHEQVGFESPKIFTDELNLSIKGMEHFQQALKDSGFQSESIGDWSNNSFVELPIPRVCASAIIRCSKMPTTKTDNISATIEYKDKDGNYFKKPIILNSQGSSSLGMIRPDGQCGNLSIDLTDDSKIKFGNWVSQDSFHIKKYWIDIFRGQCVVGYHLIEQMYKNRGNYPYDYMNYNDSTTESNGVVREDFWTGAQCHPDGFPIIIYWDNGESIKCFGIYSFNTKKHRDVYYMKKSKASNIILDGALGTDTFWGRSIKWEQFEVRNPKDLICADGSEYDGDNPKELTGDSNIDENTALVKEAINRLSNSVTLLQENKTKEEFEKYFLVEPFIDYFLQSQVVANVDGFRKNWIWCTWDGKLWTPTVYDQDSIFGTHWTATFIDNSYINTIFGLDSIKTPSKILNDLYFEEIKARYKELRDSNIFSVDNIYGLLTSWLARVGYDNIENEVSQYPEIVSYRDNQIADSWEFLYYAETENDNFSITANYSKGDEVVYKKYKFRSKTSQTGILPLKKIYDYIPTNMGYYNSPKRVYNWLISRINYLDRIYNYNK